MCLITYVCRHTETFAFANLTKARGVFLIEFVGGGFVSRAVIRKVWPATV
jgi:hypothetical protein